MTRLSVNVNKVALLRNSRPLDIPSVMLAAELAIDAGAHGITVHPRPDARHIRPHDVHSLRKLVRARGVEFNIEGNPLQPMLELVRAVRPDQCTLVPDDPNAATSDHGWDLEHDGARLQPVIAELKALGVRVSLFMDAVDHLMAAARATGADRVELYTEPYARAFGNTDQAPVLARYVAAAKAAQREGLGVNAGHDLNRDNLPLFLSTVPRVLEVSIGHALIADALEFGMKQTVALYLGAVSGAAGSMIIGIGVDLADANRIERMLVEYGSRFAERILAPSERAAYRTSGRPTWFVANRFAAKEALSKALGTGLRFPVTLHTISVVSDAVGKPEFRFHGPLPEYLAGRGVSRCHLTLSHERDLACAMVVVEG